MYPMYWANSYVGGISKVKEAEMVSGNKVQNTREKSKEIMKKRLKIKNIEKFNISTIVIPEGE